MTGPLSGLAVVELAGIGPAPYCGMLLADLGADVVLVERPGVASPFEPHHRILRRGRKSVALDLKDSFGVEALRRLIENSDALVEGFRPGVLERLGFAPQTCFDLNPSLVIGRMTGWGQDGPLSATAGHDLNYIALSGALHLFGTADRPPAHPLNLLGDFGGGGLVLAFGMVSALLEARSTGRGQVVDAAIVDGVASMLAMHYAMLDAGLASDRRGENELDGSAPYYGVYTCADGRHVAVAAMEEQFYHCLLDGLGLAAEGVPDRADRRQWPRLRELFQQRFATRSAAEWEQVFAGVDACVTPVLTPAEAPDHAHHSARGTFTTAFGTTQPGPAPRFSRTPLEQPTPPPKLGEHTESVLAELGLTDPPPVKA